MITLQEVLSQKNELVVKAKHLGFINVRIFCEEGLPTLDLIVSLDPANKQVDFTYTSALAATLMKQFNCEVNIIAEESIKPLYKQNILGRAVSIEDEATLQSFFKKLPQDVKFHDIPEGKYDKITLDDLLEIAENILKEAQLKKKVSSTEFFSKVEGPAEKHKRSVQEQFEVSRKKPRIEYKRGINQLILVIPLEEELVSEKKMDNPAIAQELADICLARLKGLSEIKP